MKKGLIVTSLLTSMLLTSCTGEGILFSHDLVGSGEVTSYTYTFASDTALKDMNIEISNIEMKNTPITLNIYDYDTPHVVVTTEQNLIDTLSFAYYQGEKTLKIKGVSNKRLVTDALEISIYGVTTKNMELNGGFDIDNSKEAYSSTLNLVTSGVITGKMNLENVDDFYLNIKGTSNITFNTLDLNSLNLTVSGSAIINSEEGNINIYNDLIEGTADINMLDVKINRASLNVEGTANYLIDVEEILDLTIEGVMDLQYKGNPERTSKVIGQGIANVKRIE